MIKIGNKITLKDRTYQIQEFYTCGGQSNIYFASNLKADSTKVVVKQTEISNSEELKILKEINHPNLPKIIDDFVEDYEGKCYQFLVMEPIIGCRLNEIIKSPDIDIPYFRTISWAKQLLDILIYLQQPHLKIIHKDICPTNIIIEDSNKVHLIDFGISKKEDTQDYRIEGTDGYMSPEQSEGKITDYRSDIYSFSATVYYLLTNKKPEKSINRKNSIEKGQSDPLLSVIDLCETLPQSLSDLISKGMSLDPIKRPKDANQMRKLLEEFEKDDSLATYFSSSHPLDPEQITFTSQTKVQNNPSIIVIPIPQQKPIKLNWKVSNLSLGSEAGYSLYFLEDALKAQKNQREEIKNRFISVVGRSRIDNDIELSKLLNILETLCKDSLFDENSLTKEISVYKNRLEVGVKPSPPPIVKRIFMDVFRKNWRKIKLRTIQLSLIIGILLVLFAIWYCYSLFFRSVTEIPSSLPSVSPITKSFIGQKGKIAKTANLRKNAGQNSEDVGTLHEGSEVEILDFQNNDGGGKSTIWFRVKILSYGCNGNAPPKCGKDAPNDADEGWVSNQFVGGLR